MKSRHNLKSLFAILLLSMLGSYAFGQSTNPAANLEKLRATAVRLESEIKVKSDSLRKVKEELKYIEDKGLVVALQAKDKGVMLPAVLRVDGKIRPSAEPVSKPLTTVSAGDSVLLTDYKDGYWVVNKGQYFGYLSDVLIVDNKEISAFRTVLTAENKKLQEEAEAAEREKERRLNEKEAETERKRKEAHRAEIIKKYGKETGEKLLAGKYWLGMSDEMARVSLGLPNKINRSVGGWGVSEQWVYSNIYLYFRNGKLESFQN